MRTPIDQYIIDTIRTMRKKRKISQEALAYALGFESKAYIGAIESRNPARDESYNTDHLNEIARILNCSPKDFMPQNPL